MRNFITVINKIIEVAPDLKDVFAPLKTSLLYTAPELITFKWHKAANILNFNAANHSQKIKIYNIFRGINNE